MWLVLRLTMGKAQTFSPFSPTDDGPLLPQTTQQQHPSKQHPQPQKSKIRVRAVLTHCLYRRVIIWTVAVIILLSLTLFSSGVHPSRGKLLGLVDFGKGDKEKAKGADKPQESKSKEEEKKKSPHWMKYRQ